MTNSDEKVRSMAIVRARPARTLGEAIESLPFHAPSGNPRLEVGTLPNDELPELDLPGVEDEPSRAGDSPSKGAEG